jgi:putative flippase GtrA
MQFIRFGVVGVANTLVDFVILNLLLYLADYPGGADLLFCNGIAFFVASLNSYLLNKNWTFADRVPGTSVQLGLFLGFTLVGMAINSGIVYLLAMPEVAPLAVPRAIWINIAKVIATVVSMVWNFTGYRRVVFRPPSCHAESSRPNLISSVFRKGNTL